MNFAAWSIRNPIPAILFFIMMTLFGFYGFQKLPIQNLPDIHLPTVTVTLPCEVRRLHSLKRK